MQKWVLTFHTLSPFLLNSEYAEHDPVHLDRACGDSQYSFNSLKRP